jgi:ArsR family transcriptional regulator
MSSANSYSTDDEERLALAPETVARLCKALGHPARMAIIDFLKANNFCLCGRIVDHLPLAQSTVSQHLKCLKESGLINVFIEGSARRYCLNQLLMARLRRSLAKLLQT